MRFISTHIVHSEEFFDTETHILRFSIFETSTRCCAGSAEKLLQKIRDLSKKLCSETSPHRVSNAEIFEKGKYFGENVSFYGGFVVKVDISESSDF